MQSSVSGFRFKRKEGGKRRERREKAEKEEGKKRRKKEGKIYKNDAKIMYTGLEKTTTRNLKGGVHNAD